MESLELSIPSAEAVSFYHRLDGALGQLMYERAYREWKSVYSEEALLHLTYSLLRGESHRYTKEDVKVIIRDRLKAQRLRSVFVFFDETHRAPQKFNKFIIAYGKLKDALDARVSFVDQHGGVCDPLEIQALEESILFSAKKLKIAIENQPKKSARKFIPASRSSIQLYLSEHLHQVATLARIDTTFDVLPELYLPEDDFHQLRKLLRDFVSFFSLLPALLPLEPSISADLNLIERIDEASAKMGKKRDKLVKEALIIDHDIHSECLKVPRKAREASRELIRFFSQST